jgi:hypothetical protein
MEKMAPLRQTMACHTYMLCPTKEAAVVTAQEPNFLKAQAELQDLVSFLQQSALRAEGIDRVERELMRRLLALGLSLLELFIAEQGDGDVGPDVQTDGGRTLRRLLEPYGRHYVSIFGTLAVARVVYGSRKGQRIEHVPLDQRLGLPAGDFSNVLEDWVQRFCLKGSFAEAAEPLEALLGLRLGSRTLQHMNRELAAFVPPFRDAVEPPPAAEEGTVLVVTVVGKGIPLRRGPSRAGAQVRLGRDEPGSRRRGPLGRGRGLRRPVR